MDPLVVEHAQGVTRLTLNRPDKANALDAATVDALRAAVARASGDGTRLLVLSGTGRNFCAGFDFGGFEEQSEGELLLRFVRIELLLQALWHAPFATAALAHGGCYGAGADLFCACDHRVAAPGSRLRMPGLRFGLVLGTRRLAVRVGASAARRILASSRVVETGEAHAIGLVDAIAPADEWPAAVAAFARDATVLEPGARAALNRLTAPDTRDADLADLVRSAQAPGLKERIRAFRAAAN